MGKNPTIVDFLNQEEYRLLISNMYMSAKEYLDEEFQDMDDDEMISYVRAHFTNIYESIDNEMAKGLFLMSLGNGFTIVELMDDFIEKVNGTKAKIGDMINKNAVEQLQELQEYKDTPIYRELSKSDEEISKIIREFHGYSTITELKRKAEEKDEPRRFPFRQYKVSKEELEIIERTKKYFFPNQLAHMLYDEKISQDYYCDHEIRNDDEILKKLLVTTNKDNPRFEIIFRDGMIVDYYKGEIRVKPYSYRQVLEYTKLFCAANFEEMRECFENTNGALDQEITSYRLGRQMIINSFVNVYSMLFALENIYTQKMIDDSKKTFVKMKETAKKYDL